MSILNAIERRNTFGVARSSLQSSDIKVSQGWEKTKAGLAELLVDQDRRVAVSDNVEIREHLHLPRPVFAMYLRTNARTLENWEQGRAKSNAQATTLIRLVQKYPETVGPLAVLV